MSNSTQNETHNVCNERLAREGGQSRCCDCEPHEGCTLGMKTQQDTLQDTVQDTQNDWVKRFNDEFPCLMHFRPNKRSYGYSEVGNDVKAFIAKLLADARKEELDTVEKLLCTHNYSSMKSKETFNVKEEIRGVLATLKEERV